jgi:hypothetical protein
MLTSIMSANFDAVAFMRFGQNRQAASTLKLALQQLAATCPEASTSGDAVLQDLKNIHSSSNSVPQAQDEGEHALDDQPGIFTIKILADDDSTGFLSSSSFFSSTADGEDDASQGMFCRAFVFSPTYGQNTSNAAFSDKISAECAALCLYNLGLCFQLEGLRNGDSAMLAKSIQLYARAYKVVGDCRLAPHDPLVVLLMAVSVNLACIHAELYDLAGAEMWRNTFRSIYTWATRSLPPLPSSLSATASLNQHFLPWEPEE